MVIGGEVGVEAGQRFPTAAVERRGLGIGGGVARARGERVEEVPQGLAGRVRGELGLRLDLAAVEVNAVQGFRGVGSDDKAVDFVAAEIQRFWQHALFDQVAAQVEQDHLLRSWAAVAGGGWRAGVCWGGQVC